MSIPLSALLRRHAIALLLVLVWQPLWAEDFAGFHARFRAAVGAQDGPALAGLSRLPFLFEGRALDRAGFQRDMPRLLFADAQRRCLARQAALPDGGDRRVVFCRPYAFYFGRVDGQYRFLEFAADGEDAP